METRESVLAKLSKVVEMKESFGLLSGDFGRWEILVNEESLAFSVKEFSFASYLISDILSIDVGNSAIMVEITETSNAVFWR
jgi:hypothetical protein